MKATDVMYFFKTIFLFIAQLLTGLLYITACYLWGICDILTKWLATATNCLEKLNVFINGARFKKQPKGE